MALPLSFEFFPPKTPEGAQKLRAVRQQLYAARPEFCSVTYGAGGSTQEGTIATVADILAEGGPAAAHFSCIGAIRARLCVLIRVDDEILAEERQWRAAPRSTMARIPSRCFRLPWKKRTSVSTEMADAPLLA